MAVDRHVIVDVLCGFAECNDSYEIIADRIVEALAEAERDGRDHTPPDPTVCDHRLPIRGWEPCQLPPQHDGRHVHAPIGSAPFGPGGFAVIDPYWPESDAG